MNSASTLLVLGSTGQVGKLIAKSLRRRKANFSVGSRRKENLKELEDQFGASRFIDLDDPRTFDQALKYVTCIFLITGYTVDMLVQSKSLIDAARRNGIKHIVHLGAFTTDREAYATVFAWHQMIEIYIQASGVAWICTPTCSCRICEGMPRSRVASTVITLPKLLGIPLWKM